MHQATGILSVALSIPVTEALVRLRAYAYATERSVADVAIDIRYQRNRTIHQDRIRRHEAQQGAPWHVKT